MGKFNKNNKKNLSKVPIKSQKLKHQSNAPVKTRNVDKVMNPQVVNNTSNNLKKKCVSHEKVSERKVANNDKVSEKKDKTILDIVESEDDVDESDIEFDEALESGSDVDDSYDEEMSSGDIVVDEEDIDSLDLENLGDSDMESFDNMSDDENDVSDDEDQEDNVSDDEDDVEIDEEEDEYEASVEAKKKAKVETVKPVENKVEAVKSVENKVEAVKPVEIKVEAVKSVENKVETVKPVENKVKAVEKKVEAVKPVEKIDTSTPAGKILQEMTDRNRENAKKTVHLKNLKKFATELEIMEGLVNAVYINRPVINQRRKEFKDFAFIHFGTEKDAQNGLKVLNDKTIKGNKCAATFFNSKNVYTQINHVNFNEVILYNNKVTDISDVIKKCVGCNEIKRIKAGHYALTFNNKSDAMALFEGKFVKINDQDMLVNFMYDFNDTYNNEKLPTASKKPVKDEPIVTPVMKKAGMKRGIESTPEKVEFKKVKTEVANGRDKKNGNKKNPQNNNKKNNFNKNNKKPFNTKNKKH